jgi:hypothetical protein
MSLNVEGLAVFIASVAVIGLKAFWYSPFLFGPFQLKWFIDEKAAKPAVERPVAALKFYFGFGKFLITLLLVFGLAFFIFLGGADIFFPTLLVCFLWFGFIAFFLAERLAEKKNRWRIFLLEFGYQFAAFCLAAAIITAWPV